MTPPPEQLNQLLGEIVGVMPHKPFVRKLCLVTCMKNRCSLQQAAHHCLYYYPKITLFVANDATIEKGLLTL